jgi:hypothetical protein
VSDTNVRWIVTNAPRETAERYAYGTTHVVRDYPGEGYGPVTLLVVATLGNVSFSADYQADRLRSGLYVAVVAETYADAHSVMVRASGVGDWSPVSV